MNQRTSMVARLDNVLTALEELILSGNRQATFLNREERERAVFEIKSLLDVRIRKHSGLDLRRLDALAGAPSRHRKSVPSVPRDLAARVRLLRNLLGARPELSPRISAVFGGGRNPSRRQVDELTRELVRLGVLKKT